MSELDELLASYSFDTETVWETYKDAFLRRSPQERDAQLQGFDKYVVDSDKMATLSHEAAELLQRKRELLSIHGTLRKLGALMDLANALEAAKQKERVDRWNRGEATVASQLKLTVPAIEFTPAIHEHFAIFTRWCEVRACRKCPAKPATIAAFVLEQKELGVPDQTIIERLEAIDAQHQHFGLPSSVHTRIVDAALDRALDIKPPRWNHLGRAEWARLPPLVRAAITKREDQRDLALRHSQSKIARELELRQTNGADKTVHIEEKVDEHGT